MKKTQRKRQRFFFPSNKTKRLCEARGEKKRGKRNQLFNEIRKKGTRTENIRAPNVRAKSFKKRLE